MAEIQIEYDVEALKMRFSGSYSIHEFSKVELSAFDRAVLDQPYENPSDFLLSLELIFRKIEESRADDEG